MARRRDRSRPAKCSRRQCSRRQQASTCSARSYSSEAVASPSPEPPHRVPEVPLVFVDNLDEYPLNSSPTSRDDDVARTSRPLGANLGHRVMRSESDTVASGTRKTTVRLPAAEKATKEI